MLGLVVTIAVVALEHRKQTNLQRQLLVVLSRAELANNHVPDALRLALAAWPSEHEIAVNKVVFQHVKESVSAALQQLNTKKILHTDTDHPIFAISQNGKFIIQGGTRGNLRRLNAQTGEQIGPKFVGHQGRVTDIKFAPDNRTFASIGEKNIVRIWDISTGLQVGDPIHAHREKLHFNRWWDFFYPNVTFAPDGKTMLSTGDDGFIRLWNLASRHLIWEKAFPAKLVAHGSKTVAAMGGRFCAGWSRNRDRMVG